MRRLAALALLTLLLPGAAVAQSPEETAVAPSDAALAGADEPLPLGPLAEQAAPWTVRIVASGRVGSGLLVDGTWVITLLTTVRVGYPATVQTGGGFSSLARIRSWDRVHGLALLELDTPVPDPPTPGFGGPVEIGDALVALGHGGSVGLSVYDDDLRGLAGFSPLPVQVIGHRVPTEEEQEAGIFPDFLVDRAPGDGDRGAPLLDEAGRVVGLLRSEVPDGGGRAVAIPAAALTDLLVAPRDRKYLRPTHLQTWSGGGFAAHNRPSMIGGFARLGFRVAILDALRIEPWAELTLGTRAGFSETDDDGDVVSPRPRDLWWSFEAGADFGYRVPIRVEGSRDYIVPNVGFRLGWNRFQHGEDVLLGECEDDGCRWTTTREIDQVREFRAGVEIGADVRHGRFRIGYRFFIDPTAPAAHSMHRLLFTVDGLPLDIAIGDSR